MIVLQNCHRVADFYTTTYRCSVADDLELLCHSGYPVPRSTYFVNRGIRLPILSRFEPGSCIVFPRGSLAYNELQTHDGSIFFTSNGHFPVQGATQTNYGTYITDACMIFTGPSFVVLEDEYDKLLGLH